MMTKPNVYLEPTSRLVYYRVFEDESPYSKQEIEAALKRRNYISFERSPEMEEGLSLAEQKKIREQQRAEDEKDIGKKLKRTFTHRFVSLEDEERRVAERGKGLSNYVFEPSDDLYCTLVKILKYENSISLFLGFGSLTWSEFALFQYIAKRMVKLHEARISQFQRRMQEKLNDFSINTLEKYMNMRSNETLLDLQARILDEELFKEYFKYVVRKGGRVCIAAGLGKIPMNHSFMEELAMFKNPACAIGRRLIPTSFSESLWDRMAINAGLEEEASLVLQNGIDNLTPSIKAQEDIDVNISNKVKYFVIAPLKTHKF